MSRLAIIGSRDFSDQSAAEAAFMRYCCEFNETTQKHSFDSYKSYYDTIVSGGARGADRIGAVIAKKWGLELVEYLPDWNLYRKRAGFIRNETIISNSDAVLAFWDGVSKGTGNSLSIAKKLKKPTIIIYF